jgi:hypothetical protein
MVIECQDKGEERAFAIDMVLRISKDQRSFQSFNRNWLRSQRQLTPDPTQM